MAMLSKAIYIPHENTHGNRKIIPKIHMGA
jgi:hypothetical protein